MPTILRIGPYRFHFYSREPNESPNELNKLAKLVEKHKFKIEEAWNRFHG